MSIDYEALADEDLPEDLLLRISTLAERQGFLEDRIKDMTDQTKKLTKEHRKLSEETLPTLLDEAGVSELRLADGTKVTVKEFIRPPSMGANAETRLPMITWLEEADRDDVVKDSVTALFGKGEGELAEMAVERLSNITQNVERFRTVNPMTLKALIKEMLEQGEDVPLDELGIFVGKVATLEGKK